MAFQYMNLTQINSSDYVTPEPINRNFEKLDVLGLDYVVESGNSGEWWFRKWKSGRCECGVDKKQWGNLSYREGSVHKTFYFSSDLSFGAFPFSFSSAPFVQITYMGDLNFVQGNTAPIVIIQNSASTTMSPNFQLMDFIPRTDMAPALGIHVVGQYSIRTS